MYFQLGGDSFIFLLMLPVSINLMLHHLNDRDGLNSWLPPIGPSEVDYLNGS